MTVIVFLVLWPAAAVATCALLSLAKWLYIRNERNHP